MTRVAAPKLGGYAGFAALALLAALALERPELAALAAPFALLAALAPALTRAPAVDASVSLERERVVEGDEVEVAVRVAARSRVGALDVILLLPSELAVVDGESQFAVRLSPGQQREVSIRLRCDRWGAYHVGELLLRATDALGVVRHEGRLDRRVPLRVYPRAEDVGRRLLRPLRTQVFSGNQVSRARGEGIEFADVRPFAPGDRVKRINWRASARRSQLWVNERHPERNADVVLFLDSFAEVGAGETTLDAAIRAAAGLADRYLREKDRVGLVSFGGRLAWLVPASGPVQLYRILDAALETEIVVSHAWREIDVIPRRTLPPQALVLALTPLLDERSIAALLDLRARGFDVAVVEVSPRAFVEPGTGEERELAYRMWQLRHEVRRARFERAGVPVAVWDDERGLVPALEEVRTFRRSAARAPAV